MTKRKQRQRPAAGIEVVYKDAWYSVIALNDPRYKGVFLRVYSDPIHYNLQFIVWSVGIEFWCKPCGTGHTLRWSDYHHKIQANEPPYAVLCSMGITWLVRSDEQMPRHLKARTIYTLSRDMIALIDTIAQHVPNRSSADSRLAFTRDEN